LPGVVPLGRHFIKIVRIVETNKVILSNEHGTLAGTWNHMLKIETISDGKIKYTDEIDTKAGGLTLCV
jgi:hypothetical protein